MDTGRSGYCDRIGCRDYESDYDGLADVVAECEAASDCSFLDAEEMMEVITPRGSCRFDGEKCSIYQYDSSSVSILALIGKATGLVENRTSYTHHRRVALVHFLNQMTILSELPDALPCWRSGLEEALSPCPVSGVVLMGIHGLYGSLRPEQSELPTISWSLQISSIDQGREKGGASCCSQFYNAFRPIIRWLPPPLCVDPLIRFR